MYFWNLTIDTVTCIQLVLAIGLAVDYSAHIGHTYMTVTGTRNGEWPLLCKPSTLSAALSCKSTSRGEISQSRELSQ